MGLLNRPGFCRHLHKRGCVPASPIAEDYPRGGSQFGFIASLRVAQRRRSFPLSTWHGLHTAWRIAV